MELRIIQQPASDFLHLLCSMSFTFSGWEACCEKGKHLKSGQAPSWGHGYIMYHGTHKNNAHTIIMSGFKPSAGGTLGPGVYCSRDINKALGYPAFCPPDERVVLKLWVKVGKVKRIDAQNIHLATSWHQNGYDTAWLPPSMGIHEEDCVWDPKRLTVISIAHCTDANTKTAVEGLIRQKAGGKAQDQKKSQCQVCKKQMEETHNLQKCWSCPVTICPFMDKHICHTRS
ncbi:hypothetical protein GN956_G3203 [Arapaima gigas]